MNFFQYPVTLSLIAANVIFSLIGFYQPSFLNRTIMSPYLVKRKHQYYRMITSGFLHADFIHLFFNMFTLYFFGNAIEFYFSRYGLGGTVSYVVMYFAALLVSDIPSYIKHQENPGYHSLGASGAVSAVVFASIVFGPWNKIWLYGAFGISFLVYAVLFIMYCINMGKKANDNINHDAHLWGSLFGLVFTLALIMAINPDLMQQVIQELIHPSLLGRNPIYMQ